MKTKIFCDFDGTITDRDTLDAVADTILGEEIRIRFDEKVLEGKLQLWKALDQWLQECRIPLPQAIEKMRTMVRVDPHFESFCDWCCSRGYSVEILSAGLPEIIRAFVPDRQIPVHANRTRILEDRFGLIPIDPECSTGVDKGGIIRMAKGDGFFTVFVGDGLSDRLAVPHANLVYAKKGLAKFCKKEGIAFQPFESFRDIQESLEPLLKSHK